MAVFYSDLPFEEDGWRKPQMMEICQKCEACLRKCPTRAITPDRFLLRAERCFVFHNERPPDYPFPAWIDPGSHNCLIGFMLCQQFCPENKSFLEWVEGNEVFSQEETSLPLRDLPLDQLPETVSEKLKRLELLDSLDILPRNLGFF